MTALFTAAELRAATGGRLAEDVAVTGITIDSRGLAPGDLFVALRAARDGHAFVPAAFAAGAACALVDHAVAGGPVLLVDDTLAGLTALGAAGRARSAARFVGVTGSVGKTTTKDMLRIALGALAPTHGAAASFNNHWGVPLTLARTPRDAAFAVIEMGMNHRHEIAPLSRLARPDAAVITAIGTAHLGNLGSEAAIAEEKADILEGLAAGGPILLPADTPHLPRLLARARQAGARAISFGAAPGAAIRLLDLEEAPSSVTARIDLGGRPLAVTIGAPGRHLALNACAVLGVVDALGLDVVRAAAALAGFGAAAGRGARHRIAVRGGAALLIDDSYNASTASIRAGLAVLAAQPARRRIAVLGDMRELGDAAPAIHAALAPEVAAVADLVFCCGPMMAHLFAGLPEARQGLHAPDSAALASLLPDQLTDGDAILVKGSLGSAMARIVTALLSTQSAPAGRAGAEP
jgi:UDP-N-acetylmuramoyl-tripeptide--D-alanyl-D-alanine ligase